MPQSVKPSFEWFWPSFFLFLHLLMCHSHECHWMSHCCIRCPFHCFTPPMILHNDCVFVPVVLFQFISTEFSNMWFTPRILELHSCETSSWCIACHIACYSYHSWPFKRARELKPWPTRTTTGISLLSQMVWPYGLRSPVLINHAKTSECTEVATVPAGTLYGMGRMMTPNPPSLPPSWTMPQPFPPTPPSMPPPPMVPASQTSMCPPTQPSSPQPGPISPPCGSV